MAWNPFKALTKRAQKASKKQQTRKAKASPSRSKPKSSGKKSGGNKKNNNTKPTGTANHRGGTTAASNRRRNQDTYQNRKNRQQQAQKRQEARQQNRSERAKTGGTGQHRGGTTYKRYDTKSKYTTANQRREGANRAKETGAVKTASTVASLTAGTGKYIAERAAGAVSKAYTSASEHAYRNAGSGHKGTTPSAPTKNDRLNDTQKKQRQDYYDARQKQKQREKDIASHGDSFTYTDSKGKRHTQSYAKGGHDVNAKITNAKERTLEEATKGLSDKEHTLDLSNIPIYGKKVKADKERQKAEARAEAAESKLEAVQNAAKDFDKVAKDNGWDDDTVLDNGMTVAQFRSQYLKDANAEMDKALNKSLKSVNKSIEESGKLKFSNKDLGKGGIKLAAEFADYLIPYGATAKGTIKAVEAARAASKAAKAGRILTETAEDGAKIISKAAKNKGIIRRELQELLKQGKSKEEALKIVQKKLQKDVKKQGFKNELIANAVQDATLGTAIDLYKGGQEGLRGKDLGKYMAQNAALNAGMGVVASRIAGRTSKAAKASLNREAEAALNETIGIKSLSAAERKRAFELAAKADLRTMTKEDYAELKTLNNKAKAIAIHNDEIRADLNKSVKVKAETLNKLSKETGVEYKVATTKEISDALKKNERYAASVDDDFFANGVVVTGKGGKKTIYINSDSTQALGTIAGHETTHLLAGTKQFDSLKSAVKEYAESLGEYSDLEVRYADLYKQEMKGMSEEDAQKFLDEEITSELVGRYLFSGNADEFVKSLSLKDRNVFQKMYDYVVDALKKATGTAEAKQLNAVKESFEKAYREMGETSETLKRSLDESIRADEQVLKEQANNIPPKDSVKYSKSHKFNKPKLTPSDITDAKGRVTEEADDAYMAAAKSGDRKQAQKFVDAALEARGYTDVVYHGTSNFGFTEFDPEQSYQIFASSKKEVAESYTTGEVRDISSREPGYGADELDDLQWAVDSLHSDFVANALKDFLKDFDNGSYSYTARETIEEALEDDKSMFGYLDDDGNDIPQRKVDEVLKLADKFDSTVNPPNSEGIYRLRINPKNSLEVNGNGSAWNGIEGRSFKESDEAVAARERIEAFDEEYDAYVTGEINKNPEYVKELIGLFKEKDIDGAKAAIKRFKAELGVLPKYKFADSGMSKTFSSQRDVQKALDDFEIEDLEEYSTREIANWAEENGYDTVIFKDIYDIGWNGWRGSDIDDAVSDVYVSFNPERYKSADPITYDDNGDIIPLSKRGDETTADLRFSKSKKEERKELYRILGGDYNAEDKQYAETIFDGIKKEIKDGNDEDARMWARTLSEELKDLTDRVPNEEAAAELSGAKKYLREVTFHIPQSDHMGSLKEFKEHLGEYDPHVLKFRKSTTGKVPSRGVDDMWGEMSNEYPEMFPASITDDVERFHRMAEVSKMSAADTEYRVPIPEEFEEAEIEAAARDIFNLAKEQVEPKKGATKPAETAKPSEEVSAPKEPEAPAKPAEAKPAEENPAPAAENKPVKAKAQPKPETPAEPKTEPPAATPRGNATKDELEAFRETDTYKGFMKTKSDYASEPLKRRVDNALKYGLDVRKDVEEFYGLGRDIAALRAKAKNSHTQEHIEQYEREANEAYAQQTRIAENIYRDYARHIEKTFGKPHAASDITAVESDGIHTALESVGGADGVAKEIKKASSTKWFVGSKKSQKLVAEEMKDYKKCLNNYLTDSTAHNADMQYARSAALLDNISAKLRANPDDAEAMADLLKVVEKLGDDGSMPTSVRRAAKAVATSTPKGRVGIALKSVDDLNARYGERIDGVLELTDDEITKLTVTEPGEELDELYDTIGARLWDNIPATRMEKFNEMRHMFMLFNARTHGRNIFGNQMFKQVRKCADTIECALQDKVFRNYIESLGGEVDRVKVKKKELLEHDDFLSSEFKEIYDASDSVQRFMETGRPDGVPVVKQKQLNWFIQTNYRWLEKEDMWSFAPAFKKSYLQYVKAKNWDIKNLTPEQKRMAQDRALFDAEYATFRDTSLLSSWLTGKKHMLATKEGKTILGTAGYRALNAALEGVIPFVKTPVNIFRRSVDFSPISLGRAIFELSSKDPEVFKQGIKHLSTGGTGTMIAGMGFFLNQLGIFGVEVDLQSGEHSGSRYYDSDMGYQDYSLVIDIAGQKTSWTLDWAQPVQTSLFMGAALNDMWNDMLDEHDFTFGTDTIAGLFALTAPVFDASFMSSAKEMVETFTRNAAKEDSEGELSGRQALAQLLFADLPKNYFSSAVPQVFSQAANVSDKYQRDTSSTREDPIAASWDSAGKQIINRLPGLRQALLQKKVDRRGNDKLNGSDNIAIRLAMYAMNPSNVKLINEDKYDRELFNIRNGIKDINPKLYKSFFYHFTGHPDYELPNGKRMTYKQLHDYSAASRKEQDNMIHKMIDADSYKGMTKAMKGEEVEDAYYIGNMVGDHDTFGVGYAISVMKKGGNQRDESDAALYKRYKEEGGKDREAFWTWRVEKERLMARAHASGDDVYRVKGLVAIEQGNDALLAASNLKGNKENELRHYWEIKSKRHGAKAKGVCFDKLSDACCRIMSNLKGEKCDGESLSMKSAAAGKVAVDHKKIDEEEYRALGHFWNSAQAGGGLMLKYNKNHKYDLPKLEQYSYELERRISKRGEDQTEMDVAMDYIENELKIKNNDERACAYQILYLGGYNSPYNKTRRKNPYKEKIDDHLEWGEDKDDEWGEAKKSKGRGGWGRRGRRGWGGGGWGSGGGGGGVAAEESAVAVSPVTGARYKTPAYTAATAKTSAPQNTRISGTKAKATDWTKQSTLTEAYRKRVRKQMQKNRLV